MRRNVALGGSLLATVLLGVAFGEGIKSGLQVGEAATPFNVRNITGQNCAVDYAKDDRGTLCYR
jgi:hypothetical protein